MVPRTAVARSNEDERKESMSNAVDVTESKFEEEVLKSEVPVLIDFWATWCGPCKQVAPVVDEIASDYAGKLKVMKVNVDDERTLAIKYGIMSIPTLLFFKGGEVKDQIVGAVSKQTIAVKVDNLV